jgi:PilZ domain
MQPRTRRVQRIHLPQPLVARLGTAEVVLIDVSILGARVEHHTPLMAGGHTRLSFVWNDEEIATDCRIVRSRLERFSVGTDGMTIYHSGVEFEKTSELTRARLKRMLERFITRALEEQKLNARGVLPQHDAARMPIFRHGGQLTANRKDVREAVGSAVLPTSRIVADSGYVCYQLDGASWRKKRTHDPGQPSDGFTISAVEDHEQAELLCDAYRGSDRDGRRLIQLFAQLSIADGEGIAPGRFEP